MPPVRHHSPITLLIHVKNMVISKELMKRGKKDVQGVEENQ